MSLVTLLLASFNAKVMGSIGQAAVPRKKEKNVTEPENPVYACCSYAVVYTFTYDSLSHNDNLGLKLNWDNKYIVKTESQKGIIADQLDVELRTRRALSP